MVITEPLRSRCSADSFGIASGFFYVLCYAMYAYLICAREMADVGMGDLRILHVCGIS